VSQHSSNPRPGAAQPDGAKVAALRDAKMWSQAELAKKAGVSSKTIYNIEDGRPAYRITLGLIAKALNVEYRHLLLNETSMELLYNELIGRLNSGSTRAELLAYLQSSNFIVHTLDRPAYHEIKLHWNLRIGSFTLDLCIGELLETARRYSWHVVLIDEPTRTYSTRMVNRRRKSSREYNSSKTSDDGSLPRGRWLDTFLRMQMNLVARRW